MKRIEIFSVSSNYTRVTIWTADSKTHELVGRSSLTPDKGLTRQTRRRIIVKWLAKHGFKLPEQGK